MPCSHGSIWGKYFPAQCLVLWSDYNIASLLQVLIRHDARLPATWVVVANVESGCSMPRHSICHYVLQITAGGERAGRVVHGSQDTRRSRGATPPTRSGRWRERSPCVEVATGNDHCGRARRGSAACVVLHVFGDGFDSLPTTSPCVQDWLFSLALHHCQSVRPRHSVILSTYSTTNLLFLIDLCDPVTGAASGKLANQKITAHLVACNNAQSVCLAACVLVRRHFKTETRIESSLFWFLVRVRFIYVLHFVVWV